MPSGKQVSVRFGQMRVAVLAECYLPAMNGVTGSVSRLVRHLEARGHEALIVTPGEGPDTYSRTSIARVPGRRLPGYPTLQVGTGRRQLPGLLRAFDPDVVHLAAPFVFGATGVRTAQALGVPTVAVFQTDLAGFARRYHVRPAAPMLWSRLRAIHAAADLTLAPSTSTAWDLARHGFDRVALWPRGVDLDQFHPRRRRTNRFGGRTAVGYVGRLAAEKRVHLLAHAAKIPDVQLVIAGDGPRGRQVRRHLPDAAFLGFLSGAELGATVASLDVFVHTGRDETFCQAVQEALAAGVPVVAPASGGPLDLVRHGENGYLYPPDEPELMANAVAQLVSDPALRAELAARARPSVEHRSWERVGDALIGHYRSVIRSEVARAA